MEVGMDYNTPLQSVWPCLSIVTHVLNVYAGRDEDG